MKLKDTVMGKITKDAFIYTQGTVPKKLERRTYKVC